MLFNVLILIFISGCSEAAVRARANGGCEVSVNNGLPSPQPLLLSPTGTKDGFGFELPVPPTDNIRLNEGESMTLACPGARNSMKIGNQKEVTATCVSGTTFLVAGTKYKFSDLACKSRPERTTRMTGKKCAGKYEEIEIGFLVAASFYRLIDVCFDKARGNTLYSRFDLVKNIGGFQSRYSRPKGWEGANFFQGYDINTRYDRQQQIDTVGTILGSVEQASKYVFKSKTSDMYFARGHLTAKADFVFGAEQLATFNYVNTAPQWHCFNSGNWENIENSTRALAEQRVVDLVVYTGTHGIATLPNESGEYKELYLYVDGSKRAMPVPKFFWKVVYDRKSEKGVALLGVNNPYITSPNTTNTTEYVICLDVSADITWLTWDRNNVTAGYSYACHVSDFRKVVDTLPSINVTGLLK